MTQAEAERQGAIHGCYETHEGVLGCSLSDARLGDVRLDARDTVALFQDGRLVGLALSFDRVDLDHAVHILESAYGPAQERQEVTVQNYFGASLRGTRLTWKFADGIMFLSPYAEADTTKADLFFGVPSAGSESPSFTANAL